MASHLLCLNWRCSLHMSKYCKKGL